MKQRQLHKALEQEKALFLKLKKHSDKDLYQVNMYSTLFSYGAQVSTTHYNKKEFSTITIHERHLDDVVNKINEHIPLGEHIKLKNYAEKGMNKFALREKPFNYLKEKLEENYLVSPFTINI